MFILGDISSVLRSAEPLNIISDHMTDDITPKMKILNMVIPILMHFLACIRQRDSTFHQT